MLHHVDWVLAAAPANSPDTNGLATFLRNFFGPVILVIISIIAGFFLFTREITRFAQFLVVAILVLIVFYFPDVLVNTAKAVAKSLGVDVG